MLTKEMEEICKKMAFIQLVTDLAAIACVQGKSKDLTISLISELASSAAKIIEEKDIFRKAD